MNGAISHVNFSIHQAHEVFNNTEPLIKRNIFAYKLEALFQFPSMCLYTEELRLIFLLLRCCCTASITAKAE
jgi:hypothetical protein